MLYMPKYLKNVIFTVEKVDHWPDPQESRRVRISGSGLSQPPGCAGETILYLGL